MKKSLMLLLFLYVGQLVFAQNLPISGTITSAEDSYPLPGAGVVIKGTNKGVTTDADGKYTIQVPIGKTLEFTFVGYKTQEKVIRTADIINIALEENSRMLNEVVVIGYGTMKKSDLTGAVSSIKADQLQKTPAAGLDQALQGRAAGVTVNASSGQPGAAAEVRIRGIGTVNNSAPIYVVDGVICGDIAFLNPNDIESTEILKDASSTAIYGSRGANGVILVTTKKGGKGSANISFNMYVGVQNRWNKLDLMTGKEFARTLIDMRNVESEKNYFKNKGFNAWIEGYMTGKKSPYFPVVKSATSPNGFDYSAVETDWQDEVFSKNALIQNYHLAVDGGSEKSMYSISASYFNQEGTIIGSYYNRLTLRVNTSHQLRKWLKIGQNLSFVTSKGRNAMNNNASPGASVLSAALAMAPWDPAYYPAGTVNATGADLSGRIAASSNFKNVVNPFSMVNNSFPSDKVERMVGDIYLEITPLDGLTWRSDVSVDLSNHRSKMFKSAYEYSSFDKADKNYLSSSMSRYCTFMLENTLTYTREIKKHNFAIMAGQTSEEYNYYMIGGAGASILNPESTNWFLNQTTDDRTFAADGVSRTRMFSWLGRAHYSYDNRYMLTFNFRADGSSKFPENAWGYFPSMALGWRINQEQFMEGLEHLDNLKLRVGWGMIGNEKIDQNSFIAKIHNAGPTFVDYVFGTNQSLANGATVLTYVNNGGKWERTEQWNAGVDFGLFKGLLSGTVDVFSRNTKDMLLSVKAPAHVGNRFDAIANVGTVNNKGLEITLDHVNRVGNVNYSINGNVSFIKNQLTALNGGERVLETYKLSDEGLPLYTLWGYEYEGIYRSDDEALKHLYTYDRNSISYHAGDARYKDLNGDGKIDDNDKTNIGNPFPWLTYGLNFGLEWKGIDLQLFFQGVYGNEIYNAMRYRTEGTGQEATLSTTMSNVWTSNNPNGDIPNPYGTPNNKLASSRYVESGAYLRLKNIQLGYTLPKALTMKAFINRCRFYITVNNLFTITPYTGYDPEVSGGIDFGNYPQSRTIMIGANLNF